MNTDTGQIYREAEDIEAAEARAEPLLFGSLAELEARQAVILNRAERRAQARLRARERRKKR